MGYILFSPIGNTDPIRGFHDGAWLHICRHYRPKLSVIYLSAEMCRKENELDSDGRRKDLYVRTLGLLNQHLYGERKDEYIQLECVRDTECENAHSLETFVPTFQDILNRIHRDYPDDEMLINVSSGTAGMKGALMALSALLPYKVKAMQVSDPSKGQGDKPQIVNRAYLVDEEFICDYDNEAESENRTSVQPLINLVLEIQKNELCRLVREGDYHTALMDIQSDTLKAHVQHKTVAAIRGAERRNCMCLDEAGKALETSGFDMGKTLCKHTKDRIWQCAEYLLTMKNDLRSGIYDNVIRKLTPLLTNLCELYLVKIGKNVRENGVNEKGKWELAKMPAEWRSILDATFWFGFRDKTDLAASNMVPLIDAYGDHRAAQLADMLRDVEGKVRNTVAHQIVPFGREDIENALNSIGEAEIRTPESLLDRFQEFIECIQHFGSEYWHSYDDMNDHISNLLKSGT